MQPVTLPLQRIQGVKSIFLAEGETILDTDERSDKGVVLPSWPIELLLDIIREKKGTVSYILVDGNDRFFIFVDGSHILGVVTLPDVNIPLLRVLAKKTLESAKIREEQTEREEISGKKSPED